MRQSGRALRQFTLSKGNSAGRNSSGINLKRSTSSMGIVERIKYDPNRSSRIALVRWIEGVLLCRKRRCNTIEEKALPRQILELTTATICGLFLFSSLPGKVDQRKVACFYPERMETYGLVSLPPIMPPWSKSQVSAGSKKTCAKDVFFSALSSPKAKGETATSLSFGSSFGFPRIAVAGAKPAFFAPRMREILRGKNTFSLFEVRKWRTHSSSRRQETLGLVGAAEHNESKPKADHGSLLPSQVLAYALCSGRPSYHHASRSFYKALLTVEASHFDSLPGKPIGEGPKDGACKVDRVPVV
ncbi:unnamed protein product [Victoria cruziana]